MRASFPLEKLESRWMFSAFVGGSIFSRAGISGLLSSSIFPSPTHAAPSPLGSVTRTTWHGLRLPPVGMNRGKPTVPVDQPTPVQAPSPTPTPVPAPDPVTTVPEQTPQIDSFMLLDATTELPLASSPVLAGGATINLAAIGTRTLNIRPSLTGKIRSVLFTLDGIANTDSTAPFTVKPLRNDAGYATWTPTAGRHTLVAKPYAGPGGTGLAGAAQTITFDVIDVPVDPYAGRPVPSPGGTRYVVDPSGPIKTVAQATSLAHAGDVVLISSGTYHEKLLLTNSGTADRPITFAPVTPGTVTIDGTGLSYILRGSVSDVHVQEITFDHAANTVQSAAIEMSSRWTLTDCTIQNTDGQGLVVYGNGAVLTRVTAQYNGQEGISGSNCSNVLLTDCVTRYNNNGKANPVWKNDSHAILLNGLYYVDTSWQAGAGKWVQTDHVTLDGVQSYGNRGTGIWFDYNNTNVVVRNCAVHDNAPVTAANFWEGVGISIEVCTGPVLLQNNTVYNQVGGDIAIASSRGVTAIGNNLTGGYIALTDWDRGADYTLRNLDFHNNTFTDVYIWTGSDNWDTSSSTTKNIHFDQDIWNYRTSSSTQLAIWDGVYYRTPSALRTMLGLEPNGTFTRLI